jgi:hypothetical protein
MAPHLITESRIRGQRFYTVMRESKIRFYTTSVVAARYWITNCAGAQPLPMQADTVDASSENIPQEPKATEQESKSAKS